MQLALSLLVAGGIGWWVAQAQVGNTVQLSPVPQAVLTVQPVAAAPVVAAPLLPAPPAPPGSLAPVPAPAEVAVPAKVVAKPVARAAVPALKPAAASDPAPAKPAVAPVPSREALASKAEQLYQQALAQQKLGEAEPAMKSLREALQLNPRHAQARLALAQLLVAAKQAPAAAELLGDGLMLTPQHTGLMLALAPLWVQAGQQADAMALLAQGLKSANDDPAFHAYYASQLLRLKRPAEAVTHYRTALRSDANKSEWLLGLGLALHAAGNVRDAVDALRRASATGGLSAQNKTMVDQVIARLQPTP
jgi:MSHA biogenesis protein MshN